LALTPAQLSHGRMIVQWKMAFKGANLLPIHLLCASQRQKLLAIHVKIIRYECSFEFTP
jgi:hypothetical protein